MTIGPTTTQTARELAIATMADSQRETTTRHSRLRSIIRNEIETHDVRVVKWWHMAIARHDPAAALMLSAIISVYDHDLAQIERGEVELDAFYLALQTFSEFGDRQEIADILNKLQLLGLISVRRIPDSDWLAKGDIWKALGAKANGVEARRYVEKCGPAFAIRLETHVIEKWLEDELEYQMPPRKHLLVSDKNPRGAQSDTPTLAPLSSEPVH
jgi:hypothetical protein